MGVTILEDLVIEINFIENATRQIASFLNLQKNELYF